MHESHFAGLRDYLDQAVRQPDFDTVRRRAGRSRRRRVGASGAGAGAVALVVASLGYLATTGPQAAAPTPPPSAAPEAGWPRFSSVVASGPAGLYATVERCRECALELYASDDSGATWERRALPTGPTEVGQVPSAITELVSLGQAVLAWKEVRTLRQPGSEGTPPALKGTPEARTAKDRREVPLRDVLGGKENISVTELRWTSVDGGRTWRRAEVGTEPVATVPAGTRPVDCGLVGQLSPCRIYAVDPVSGRFAPLAQQPSGIQYKEGWTGQTNVPIGARLWVPGLDAATRKPAVASSADAGRTWRTHVFSEGVPAVAEGGTIAAMYLPTVAAGMDGTAYALTYRRDLRMDPYRTTDAGTTWRPGAGGAVGEAPDGGFVTTDGAHVIKNGQEFLVSRDGGGYRQVTLPGYPAELRQLTQVTSRQAAGRYLVFSLSTLYLSDDGWKWRRVNLP